MATKNRRVAAYLPPHVYQAFVDFKIQNGLATEENPAQNDSQALIQLLSEFLGVTHEVAHQVTRQLNGDFFAQIAALRSEMVEQIDQLSSDLQELKQEVSALKEPESLSTSDMAKRLGVASSTLSHWKKDKTPRQLAEATQARDPDGVMWVFIEDGNCFRKAGDIPGILQGELLSE
jgi:DNA-binding transcriptional regulator YiaG